MDSKEHYTFEELCRNLEISMSAFSKKASVDEGTIARIRKGNLVRQSTANKLLRAFSEIYGMKLTLENVSGLTLQNIVATQPVSTATTENATTREVPQKRSTTRRYESRAETEIPSDLPHGTIKLIDFIEKYGLPESSMSRWTKREKGIKKGEWIETTTRAKASGMGVQHFLTPAQQEKALDLLSRHGKLKTPDSEEKPVAEEPLWYLPDGE